MWTSQQSAALKAIEQWYKNPKSSPVFRLFGFAGSGKTTIAKEIKNIVKGKVLFACYTGKAALVLRKKQCYGATTIHSLIYIVEQDDTTGELGFIINPLSSATEASIIVIDEVSMVDELMALDLLSFKVKILVLGDPAQLPPVKGFGYFINARPDFMLTEVHRQAADNPIIRMSMEVREGRRLQYGNYGDSRIVRHGEINKQDMAIVASSADQILCGKNTTRNMLNARTREILGMDKNNLFGTKTAYPTIGDRLVCLKNNKEKGLLNGGLWEVLTVDLLAIYAKMIIKSLDEPNRSPVEVRVLYQFFDGTDKELHWRTKKEFDEFTYGYALTVHKSQGSQWDNVLLFDESSVFKEDKAKHLYTGITRAAEKITIVL